MEKQLQIDIILIMRVLLLCCLISVLPSQPAQAAKADAAQRNFRVESVDTHIVDEVYRLNANVSYAFTEVVLEALESGVPLTIELQIEVRQPRQWVWDPTIAELSQRYRVEYHALTQQFLISNLNSQTQKTYSSRANAMSDLGTVYNLPILDKRLLSASKNYYGRMRAVLVIDDLPAPLRVLAYLLPDWHLASEWYQWSLQ